VRSVATTPEGTIYALNNRQQLLRLVNRTNWAIVERGVRQFTMTPDGRIYGLNERGELKRYSSQSKPHMLARGVVSYATATDGTLYALDSSHQLKRLTARDHWTLIAVGVRSFVVAPNVFQELYILHRNRELTLVEPGDRRRVLRRDIVSSTVAGERGINTVQARDAAGRSWIYAFGSGVVPVLDPVEGDAPIFCVGDNNMIDQIMRYLVASGNFPEFNLWTEEFTNVHITLETLVDEVEPPRHFPYVGTARLHHCHFRCTITADGPDGPQEWILFLDRDTLIRASSFST
jgi:hypothetical protein